MMRIEVDYVPSFLGEILCLLIFGVLFGFTAVALYRSPKMTERPRHFYVLLALYSCSIGLVIVQFIYIHGYEEEGDHSVVNCRMLEDIICALVHLIETLILVMYYLRLSVFCGINTFYPDWVRYGCCCLVAFPLIVGLTIHFLSTNETIRDHRCATHIKIDLMSVILGGLLVPSSFFLLLFLLPFKSRNNEQYIWKDSIKKQIWITLLDTLNDIVFALALTFLVEKHPFVLSTMRVTLSVILTTFIFSDWRRRLRPWKYNMSVDTLRRNDGDCSEDMKVPLVVV